MNQNLPDSSGERADTASPATSLKNIAQRSARKAQTVSGGLALILSLITFSATGYLWYVLKEKQGLLKGDVVGQLEQLQTGQLSLRASTATLAEELSGVRDTQETLRAAVDKLSTDFGRARTDWMLAETEQLLFIANHRLQLAQDSELALSALRAADRQLKQIANPTFLPVRRLLTQEINQLAAINKVDYDGLVLRLNTMSARIDQLPLTIETTFKKPAAVATPTPEPQRNAWWQFGHEVWQDILSLIRIRSDAETRKPLLPADQQYFLRENMRLMLHSAQLALLQRNEAAFRQNLKSARESLRDYFDTAAPAVKAMQTEIDSMSKIAVNMKMPDISGSLTALHKLTGKTALP